MTLLASSSTPAGSELHLIVPHLMEAILGVKEPSEKARNAAFSLLVAMGQKMKEGGVIVLGDTGEARQGSAEEYMRMVGASLASEQDHTISAGVMSLSRVLFEFKGASAPALLQVVLVLTLDRDPDDITEEYQNDVLLTIYPLLHAKNREIVKSVLGFVKLSVHALRKDVVESRLSELVPGLLTCLNVHRGHFKVRTYGPT